ncbi:hypothetical protein KIH79_03625 [Bifidobacterium sp. 82T10]|uniref:ATPase BadF/BadG/BcrA/BcrD type domain-containing protein n=1 Tax=Bifidobacterium miconis TaxID=2834435 RepID=A0ABS6WDP5_9BIFI|nr:BadF/BadG/BcrA/BcrD ATPase family protein [Bifidobacterium miconis]MBW3092057.1 hypothetical protein [Bifidobacterium miconis]
MTNVLDDGAVHDGAIYDGAVREDAAHDGATAGERPVRPRVVVGIDIGGSGSRLAAVQVDENAPLRPVLRPVFTAEGPRAAVGAGGVRIADALRALRDDLRRAMPDAEVAAVGVGMTGLATLADDPHGLCREVTRLFGCAYVAVAADAITAHLGALAGRAGAVIAAGTGVIGFGTDHRDIFVRVDGWGHLLGDHGGGAWIGMRGLQSALDAYCGRTGNPSQALLERAVARFGKPEAWPKQLYTRDDRAGVLASFTPDVMACAADGDPAALSIARQAGDELAATAVAALASGLPKRVAYTGSILERCELVRASFLNRMLALGPDIDVLPAQGAPLDGAVRLASLALAGRLRERAPYLYR